MRQAKLFKLPDNHLVRGFSQAAEAGKPSRLFYMARDLERMMSAHIVRFQALGKLNSDIAVTLHGEVPHSLHLRGNRGVFVEFDLLSDLRPKHFMEMQEDLYPAIKADADLLVEKLCSATEMDYDTNVWWDYWRKIGQLKLQHDLALSEAAVPRRKRMKGEQAPVQEQMTLEPVVKQPEVRKTVAPVAPSPVRRTVEANGFMSVFNKAVNVMAEAYRTRDEFPASLHSVIEKEAIELNKQRAG
jgi:hypothetical protein